MERPPAPTMRKNYRLLSDFAAEGYDRDGRGLVVVRVVLTPDTEITNDMLFYCTEKNMRVSGIIDESGALTRYLRSYDPAAASALACMYAGRPVSFGFKLLSPGIHFCYNLKCASDSSFKYDEGHMCSRCKRATYCSQECQVADWAPFHKANCKATPTSS